MSYVNYLLARHSGRHEYNVYEEWDDPGVLVTILKKLFFMYNFKFILGDETPHRIHRTHRSLIIFWGGALPLSRPHPGWAQLSCLTNTDPNLLPFTTILSHVQ